MNGEHWILVGCWLVFGLVHSFMAAGRFKKLCQGFMGRYFAYYRLLYSILALLSLTGVLVWQFSFRSVPVGTFPVIKWLAGILAGIPGILLMGISIRKHFFNLSGVSVLTRRRESDVLATDGLHRYVRHPLYLGTLLFIWALFLFFPLMSNLLSCIMITMYTLIGIRLEEKKLLEKFGAAYASYRKRTPMLIPRLTQLPQKTPIFPLR
jgi:protein-S-isoprenylcysteine O-methyltransferase Ste14